MLRLNWLVVTTSERLIEYVLIAINALCYADADAD
jgi:hypothetical protein